MAYENTPQGGEEGQDPPGEAGRPPFVPTQFHRDLVKHCKASGMTHKDICHLVKWPDGEPISEGTLTRYFRKELDAGLPEAIAKMSSKLFQKGIDGDITAMIFWLKTRARWKETTVHEMTGADGEPLAAPSLGDFYATVQVVPASAPGVSQPEQSGQQSAEGGQP
jgi:hypothetical protein